MNRIIAGEESGQHHHPWQIALVNIGDTFPFCGGAILGAKVITTAAHCVDTRSPGSIQVLQIVVMCVCLTIVYLSTFPNLETGLGWWAWLDRTRRNCPHSQAQCCSNSCKPSLWFNHDSKWQCHPYSIRNILSQTYSQSRGLLIETPCKSNLGRYFSWWPWCSQDLLTSWPHGVF